MSFVQRIGYCLLFFPRFHFDNFIFFFVCRSDEVLIFILLVILNVCHCVSSECSEYCLLLMYSMHVYMNKRNPFHHDGWLLSADESNQKAVLTIISNWHLYERYILATHSHICGSLSVHTHTHTNTKPNRSHKREKSNFLVNWNANIEIFVEYDWVDTNIFDVIVSEKCVQKELGNRASLAGNNYVCVCQSCVNDVEIPWTFCRMRKC